LEQAEGEGPQTRPHLEHGLAGLDAGTSDDGAHRVRVHHEVLTALLRGADPRGLGELADVAVGQQQAGAVLPAPALLLPRAHAAAASGQPYTSWVVARTARQASSSEAPVVSAIVAMVSGIR